MTSCRSIDGTNRRARAARTNLRAFTLIEVVVSTFIAAIVIGRIILGYVQSANRTEWSGYSLAAQALATQRLEQTRATKWDPERGLDELIQSNFPPQITILDLPVVNTNATQATNFTTISWIQTNPPMLKLIRVDCVWRGPRGRVHTNTAANYRTPDT